MAEENQRRDSELRPSCVRLQCLRCRSEFELQGEGSEEEAGGRARRRGAAMLPEGVEEQGGEEPMTEAECDDNSKGESTKRRDRVKPVIQKVRGLKQSSISLWAVLTGQMLRGIFEVE